MGGGKSPAAPPFQLDTSLAEYAEALAAFEAADVNDQMAHLQEVGAVSARPQGAAGGPRGRRGVPVRGGVEQLRTSCQPVRSSTVPRGGSCRSSHFGLTGCKRQKRRQKYLEAGRLKEKARLPTRSRSFMHFWWTKAKMKNLSHRK